MVVFDHNQVCTTGGEVVVGGQYQYKEMSYIADVTVLADESDKKQIGFRLRVDRKTYWRGEVGDEFSCRAKRGNYGYGGMWLLLDPGTYPPSPSGPE